MKYIAAIAVCFALNVSSFARLAVAADQPEAVSTTAATEDSAPQGDEIHFVSVLTFQGEIIAFDAMKRFISLKGPNDEVLTLEARSEDDLAQRKVGERVQVRYFEGAHIGKREEGEAVPLQSVKGGLIGEEPGKSSAKQRALSASVERVDTANQEITLKGSDGSLETIMVSNPEHLSHIKIGDTVVITRPLGLALSIESEG